MQAPTPNRLAKAQAEKDAATAERMLAQLQPNATWDEACEEVIGPVCRVQAALGELDLDTLPIQWGRTMLRMIERELTPPFNGEGES